MLLWKPEVMVFLMSNSVYTQIPFGDRVFYLYESFDARSARVHEDRVGVLMFNTELMAEAMCQFVSQFNALAGLSFIRVTRCKLCVALIDVRKVKGNAIWNFK
jgi:hypothetical protein